MTDKFEAAEEPGSRNVAGLLAVVFAVAVFLLFRWSTSSSTSMTGIVESSGTISVARIKGGTREAASVRLADGRIVEAYVVSGGPLSKGDAVYLVEQRRVLGGPVYQVVEKAVRR